MSEVLRKPDWIKVRLGRGREYARVRDIVQSGRLHTVCEEASCPNRGRCWEHGRATIMILGDLCTRGCSFCGVATKCPLPPDADEPRRVAEAVASMGLADIVLTSVTRDDLADGGAAIWAETIERIHTALPGIRIEVLVPDFGGNVQALEHVMATCPEVFGHNLETVRRLYPRARSQADYERSLDVLRRGHDAGLICKTGIMVGIGETEGEIFDLMRDTRDTGSDIFTVGQYLQPSKEHLPVSRYVEPAEFERYQAHGESVGFEVVLSAPLVRSSYHSEEQAAFVARRLSGKPTGRPSATTP